VKFEQQHASGEKEFEPFWFLEIIVLSRDLFLASLATYPNNTYTILPWEKHT
jgi:hypothetical protein